MKDLVPLGRMHTPKPVSLSSQAIQDLSVGWSVSMTRLVSVVRSLAVRFPGVVGMQFVRSSAGEAAPMFTRPTRPSGMSRQAPTRDRNVRARPGIALPQPGGESRELVDRKLQGGAGLGVGDPEGRHRARPGAFVGGVGAAGVPRWSPFLEARKALGGKGRQGTDGETHTEVAVRDRSESRKEQGARTC